MGLAAKFSRMPSRKPPFRQQSGGTVTVKPGIGGVAAIQGPKAEPSSVPGDVEDLLGALRGVGSDGEVEVARGVDHRVDVLVQGAGLGGPGYGRTLGE